MKRISDVRSTVARRVVAGVLLAGGLATAFFTSHPAQAATLPQTLPRTVITSASNLPASQGQLDGWISDALKVMKDNGIPGSYAGIKRNILRESSGNPGAVNNWDSNAARGRASKGLLQVIDPTFKTYHVAGTSSDPFNPVANIVAASNYAAHRYGSIDNVNSAY
ncbi:transglycosylase SLT domain-containing protein [Streptomyces vinaceus]|uniref:transglycosylase SLT domain-containing protein n=1 Tax=Streptomyces vinaceus TaxID=1960 RepID=UPI003826BFF1